jgi:hypothetical protein
MIRRPVGNPKRLDEPRVWATVAAPTHIPRYALSNRFRHGPGLARHLDWAIISDAKELDVLGAP